MTSMYELAEKILNTFGPSGREEQTAACLRELVKPYADECKTDVLGNLICIKKGDGKGRRVLFSAHMDQIGFVVLGAEKEGYLRVSPVGGINLNVSKTRHLRFENGLQGVLVQQPLREGESLQMKHMFIDIGAESREEALTMVKPGDMAVYAPDCYRLGANRMAAPALDNRISCALLVSLMQSLPQGLHDTVIAVFSVQEEVGCRGARTAAYAMEPDVAIALDITGSGDTPETKFPALELGKGATVKIMDKMSISNPELVEELLSAAEAAGVSVQREVLPYGGTDASSIQLVRGGIKVATVSIPERYVHSACEVIDLRDAEVAKNLLLSYLK